MRSIAVKSPDGTTIAAFEAGNPAGPAILFIHGFMQCHLAWRRQFADPTLVAAFRLVAMDLRGHGASDKPVGKEHYRPDKLWADDVAAVIDQTGLCRPVLVGWSYAGRVITDYLRLHGQDSIAGVGFVGANTKTDSAMLGPAIGLIPAALSDDLATMIDGTRAFLRACFERQPDDGDFAFMLGYNMVAPTPVRAAVLSREPNPGDLLATLTCPVLVSHGSKDPFMLPAMAQFTAAQCKNVRLSMYDGVGHSTFYEDAPRFNRELAEFVRAAQ